MQDYYTVEGELADLIVNYSLRHHGSARHRAVRLAYLMRSGALDGWLPNDGRIPARFADPVLENMFSRSDYAALIR